MSEVVGGNDVTLKLVTDLNQHSMIWEAGGPDGEGFLARGGVAIYGGPDAISDFLNQARLNLIPKDQFITTSTTLKMFLAVFAVVPLIFGDIMQGNKNIDKVVGCGCVDSSIAISSHEGTQKTTMILLLAAFLCLTGRSFLFTDALGVTVAVVASGGKRTVCPVTDVKGMDGLIWIVDSFDLAQSPNICHSNAKVILVGRNRRKIRTYIDAAISPKWIWIKPADSPLDLAAVQALLHHVKSDEKFIHISADELMIYEKLKVNRDTSRHHIHTRSVINRGMEQTNLANTINRFISSFPEKKILSVKLVIDWRQSLQAFDQHGDYTPSTLHQEIFKETPIVYELLLSEALLRSTEVIAGPFELKAETVVYKACISGKEGSRKEIVQKLSSRSHIIIITPPRYRGDWIIRQGSKLIIVDIKTFRSDNLSSVCSEWKQSVIGYNKELKELAKALSEHIGETTVSLLIFSYNDQYVEIANKISQSKGLENVRPFFFHMDIGADISRIPDIVVDEDPYTLLRRIGKGQY